jgi:hypothetical protein
MFKELVTYETNYRKGLRQILIKRIRRHTREGRFAYPSSFNVISDENLGITKVKLTPKHNNIELLHYIYAVHSSSWWGRGKTRECEKK